MKKLFILLSAILISGCAAAQMIPVAKDLPQPFKGGNVAMQRFFKDSLLITPIIETAKASGMVIFKFTADAKGAISKLVVYFADDQLLTGPVIDALKRTDGKWVIPADHKFYDFIIPFSINYKPRASIQPGTLKAILDYDQNRKPIVAADQVPLNAATLLPAVIINY